ncbi:hypothetical protein EIP91_002714 [Steccherinum ochraceum]|uniref:P-loop containing nucleoside triphosphate hydrolase protein n=1 Tax=Steccherinum ochraceum TaxID=92696 RepID=A0A4R0RI15_9APHY|nr:hypothetical protein EIP91_002714 [Steccherinum ochraceum]
MSAIAGPSTSRKRKSPSTADEGSSTAAESSTKKAKGTKPSASSRKAKVKAPVKVGRARVWPEYFDSLFKIFKALNTVIAFCSSRKHLAITFPVVRSSVEHLLKQPLEMAKVAELKALLPELIRFSYVPSIELRIHAESSSDNKREGSPDFAIVPTSKIEPSALPGVEDEEHVLVLDFVDAPKGKKSVNEGFMFGAPPAMTPAATKKLIERRNNRFTDAVNELLEAVRSDEDPVELLQAAARDHIPVDPSSLLPGNKGKERDKTVPESDHRPTIDSIISEIQQEKWYSEQIVHRRIAEAKDGQKGELDAPLSDTVKQALLQARKISSLYTHQVASINALMQSKNVIVSTSTASGKSVIYQVPLLTFLEENTDATAIFIYPTKALAQDQKAALEQLLAACPGLEDIKVATYDGDTPQEERRGVRETASVIFTNFDMIHASILPHEDLWRRFLKNLKLVAVDELHYYTGIFGSHVAQVIRRLRRVCVAVGNRRVKCVSCSATISKPRRHMENLFGLPPEDIEEVVEDGAPSGRKDYLVWTPPLIDEQDPSLGHKSPMQEATRLMRFLMERGVRVILFCKIRKICEWAMKALRTELTADGRLDILKRVMAYRGGYSPQDRRKIENEAFSGHLLGIVATNALELGVDIGILDAVIMLGFPMGGIASYRQQAGRAGRRSRDALAVYVADGFPIDRHYAAHPDELWEKPMDDLLVELDSKIILEAHLQCAAHEIPLSLEDEQYFGPLIKEICDKSLAKDKEGWYHTHNKYLPYPAKHISLRGVEEERYCVVDVSKVGKSGGNPRMLEEVEISRALFEIYEGGIFIHQGLTFLIQQVSHDSKTARVVRTDANWITEPRDFTNIDAAQTFRIREIRASPYRAYYGRVELKTLVYGYYKIRNRNIIDSVDLDTPPWERETTGLWLDVPKATLQLLKDINVNPAEAIHAAEHAMMNRFALAKDLGTECKVAEKEYKTTESQRKRPARLIFFEPTGKIAGIAAKAFDHVSDIINDAVKAIDACQCEEGCTACVVSPACRENNVVSSKVGAAIVLKALAGLPVDVDLLVPQDAPSAAFDTITEAPIVSVAQGVELEKDS